MDNLESFLTILFQFNFFWFQQRNKKLHRRTSCVSKANVALPVCNVDVWLCGHSQRKEQDINELVLNVHHSKSCIEKLIFVGDITAVIGQNRLKVSNNELSTQLPKTKRRRQVYLDMKYHYYLWIVCRKRRAGSTIEIPKTHIEDPYFGITRHWDIESNLLIPFLTEDLNEVNLS